MRRLLSIALLALGLGLAAATTADATYTQQYALSQDTTFQGQVMVAMLQSSANVMTEAVTVAGHVARAQFATQVIQNPTKWQSIIAFLIASQSNNPMTPLTVPSTVADSLVQTAVDAQFGNMAGYFKQ
jgi:uncharacterized membrane protein YebE (DUF533 family)